MNQATLRQLKRKQRQAIDTTLNTQYSLQIAKTFLRSEAYQSAQHLGVYLAMPEEVSTHFIIERAWTDNKKVYLPIVTTKEKAMSFAPYYHNSILTTDVVQMLIPDCKPNTYIHAQELDTVITPLVAFDEQANRIGMGGGFYDRTFAFKQSNLHKKPWLIGLAFEKQRTETHIQTASWDIPLNRIITETTIYPAP